MHPLENLRLRAFAARHAGVSVHAVQIRVKQLARGPQSCVALIYPHVPMPVRLTYLQPFVVKHVFGAQQRETSVYAALHEHRLEFLPQLLGTEDVDADQSYLYLEYIRRALSWPWRDLERASRVLRALAHLHGAEQARLVLPSWDYEAFLQESAAETIEVVQSAAMQACAWCRPSIRHLRTVAAALPEIRQYLLHRETVVIHGDVHSGNIHVARRGGSERLFILDWARARSGSGLEDVASWLQSLGCWDEHARQRHDTLLKIYLAARGAEPRLTSDIRLQYWLAAASNALAGALRYELWLAHPATVCNSRRKLAATRAAQQWLRVIRRAAEYWRCRTV